MRYNSKEQKKGDPMPNSIIKPLLFCIVQGVTVWWLNNSEELLNSGFGI